MPHNRQKLEQIFFSLATPQEWVDYKLHRLEMRLKFLEGFPLVYEGPRGLMGLRGSTGERGPRGIQGKDGSTDTPQQIKTKLESLQYGDRLGAFAIKNLPQFDRWKKTPAYIRATRGSDPNLKPITLAQITSDINNYDMGSGTGALYRISSDAARSITGFLGGVEGREFVLTNIGSFDITLVNQSSSSSPGNRILTGTGANVTLAADDNAWIIYDPTTARWRLLL